MHRSKATNLYPEEHYAFHYPRSRNCSDVKAYPTADEYKLDITNDRLDAIIDNVVVLGEWIDSDAGSCRKILGSLKPDPAIYGEGIGIALRKGDNDLRERFNKAIVAIRENAPTKNAPTRRSTASTLS